ncbi:hypothetical protein BOX15_Mlig021677g2, partial [Macrostomum lignano]
MKFIVIFKADRQVVEANKEHLILPEELENLTDSEWLALKDSTEKWFCKALYEGQHFAAIIVQVVLDDSLDSPALAFA